MKSFESLDGTMKKTYPGHISMLKESSQGDNYLFYTISTVQSVLSSTKVKETLNPDLNAPSLPLFHYLKYSNLLHTMFEELRIILNFLFAQKSKPPPEHLDDNFLNRGRS